MHSCCGSFYFSTHTWTELVQTILCVHHSCLPFFETFRNIFCKIQTLSKDCLKISEKSVKARQPATCSTCLSLHQPI